MLDRPGPFSVAHGGPKMAQNSTKMAKITTKMALHGPKCPYMTPNGLKTLPMGELHDILSCWTTLGPFQRPLGSRWPLKRPQGGPIWHIIMPCEMFRGHFGSCRDIWGHEGIFWVMKFLHCRAILGYEWPFLVIEGHFWS